MPFEAYSPVSLKELMEETHLPEKSRAFTTTGKLFEATTLYGVHLINPEKGFLESIKFLNILGLISELSNHWASVRIHLQK